MLITKRGFFIFTKTSEKHYNHLKLCNYESETG